MRIAAVAFIIMLAIMGCGKPVEKPASAVPAGKIIATVNGEPISDKDLKLSLALRIKNNPSMKVTPSTKDEQVQILIDERLALQHKKRDGSEIKIFR